MENTKIEWATHTFSPWVGCTKISPACDHCYAESWAKRSGHPELWQGTRRRTTPDNWKKPLKWDAQAVKDGTRPRVFCSSLADVFDNEVNPQWRADLFQLISRTPNLDWLLLTKRIGNAHAMIEAATASDYYPAWSAGPWPNVWLMATVANQAEADRDIPKLLATPARIRGLSCEPLLGPIDLSADGLACSECPRCADGGYIDPETNANECSKCDGTGKGVEWAIDWVIAGAESGPKARPSHPDWFRSLRDQCVAAGVAFHFKQWGEWRPPEDGEHYNTIHGRAGKPPAFLVAPNGTVHCCVSGETVLANAMIRVGKKAAGRTLDGKVWDEFPEAR